MLSEDGGNTESKCDVTVSSGLMMGNLVFQLDYIGSNQNPSIWEGLLTGSFDVERLTLNLNHLRAGDPL